MNMGGAMKFQYMGKFDGSSNQTDYVKSHGYVIIELHQPFGSLNRKRTARTHQQSTQNMKEINIVVLSP
jgi:hypothetical protein